MKVRFSDDASTDLDRIEDHVRLENPARAVTFARELASAAIAIGDVPELYPVLAMSTEENLRRKVCGRYLIVYRLRGSEVEIVRILHGARDIVRAFQAPDR